MSILILDSHADTADTTAYVLRGLGHEVSVATSADAAIAEIAHNPPDVMVIEWMIGHERRPDVVVALRSHCEQAGKQPFTILHTTTAPSLTCSASCADVVLLKPTQVNYLVQLLDRLREARQARARAAASVLVVDELATRALDLRDRMRDVMGMDATITIATPMGAVHAIADARFDLVFMEPLWSNDRYAIDLRELFVRRGQNPMFVCVTDRLDRQTTGFDAHLLRPFSKQQLEHLLLGSLQN